MADIDLKTETPDTSLPTTGFLFGADSQSAASPSVYSTQAVATALLGSTSLTGATVTADSPVLNLAQTWNNAAVTFTGLKFNVPTDSSASGSLLMDLQVGGSSRFNVGKTGSLKLGVSPTGTNQAGTNVIIAGSQGTGTGAGGSIVFQVAPAGSSGTAQNALATALTIDSTRKATFAAGAEFAAAVQSATNVSATNNLWAGAAFDTASVLIGGAYGGVAFRSNMGIGWTSSTTDPSGTRDVILARDNPGVLALRNGANAQTFNVYNTFTDASNYERGVVKWDTNTLRIGVEAAGTGSNKVIELRNTGSRFVRMPTTGGLQFFNSASREVYIQWDAIGVRADAAFLWSSSSSNIGEGTGDTGLVRAAPNIVRVSNGSTGGGALQLTEMTAPAAPATDNVRIYAEDNGSGKTRLMALFPTGAAVQIAIEP